jgi:hypothetical protein
MSLSIVCVTNNEPTWAIKYIQSLRKLADSLCAELVLGLDKDKPESPFRGIADKELNMTPNTLQDYVFDAVYKPCSGSWILRIDNDEIVSPALADWLKTDKYTQLGYLYAFPRIYLYGDEKHFITNPGMWPDLQTRLGRKELMMGCNGIHAGNPNGTGRIVPYAIEHHTLIVKTLEERRKQAAFYEGIRKGAGTEPQWARYNLPEDFYPEFELKEYTNNGDFSAS